MSDGDDHSDGAFRPQGRGDGKEGDMVEVEPGQRQSSPATTISTVGGSHWTSHFGRKGSLDE